MSKTTITTTDRSPAPGIESTPEQVAAPQRFGCIMADPPWMIQQTGARGASEHYDLMTLDQIKGMGDAIKALTEDDAHLWLWVTNATLRDGYDVMEAWGFTPRSPLTWVKPRFTLGNYLRNATEHVLFGTRGKAPVQFRSQPTWAYWPLLEHSVKPDEIYSVVDRVSGRDTKKLELFARRQPPVPNWSVWGNEIESDVSLARWGYPVPSDYSRQDAPTPLANESEE
ncbi:MT-A70 family methyltransferase [Microbacterium sp. ASV49]|uniref:MT-A70 family methyltransferase n=1 Tax=Microbacterium candidum TaxID=3041922 RepID=A0ABT7N071_9MICO|nr:MT-A70 family methyltransferase [Microbacterium sp. ASV49]MDL9980097.1 MT-A70 family methyltransferase [Microbacterium sp. ASV49]